MTVVDRSGRTLSGQTVEAFWASIEHARPLAVAINCSLGAARDARLAGGARARRRRAGLVLPERRPAECVRRLRREAPEETAALLREFAESGLVNAVGGCCGTTPEHVAAIAEAVAGLPPRREVPAHATAAAVGRPGAVRGRGRTPAS